MNWLVVMPAWGNRAMYSFTEYALPAIMEAAAYSKSKIRFICHTDSRDFVQIIMNKLGVDCLIWDIPLHSLQENAYLTVSFCYQAALNTFARPGEAVLMATADMVVSRETFAACEARFAEGKKVVMCCGLRAIEGNQPPMAVGGEALSAWAWTHRHPWIKECIYGQGHTGIPSYVIFRDGQNVWLHGFHLHPLALVKESRALPFFGTIDYNLLDNWSREELHIVQSPDELAVIEMSPIWHAQFLKHEQPNTVQSIVKWCKRNATKTHLWLFEHPITIMGQAQHSAVVDDILCLLRGDNPQIQNDIAAWAPPLG